MGLLPRGSLVSGAKCSLLPPSPVRFHCKKARSQVLPPPLSCLKTGFAPRSTPLKETRCIGCNKTLPQWSACGTTHPTNCHQAYTFKAEYAPPSIPHAYGAYQNVQATRRDADKHAKPGHRSSAGGYVNHVLVDGQTLTHLAATLISG